MTTNTNPLPVPMTAEERLIAQNAGTMIHRMKQGSAWYFNTPASLWFPDDGSVWLNAETASVADALRYALAHTDESGRLALPKGE